MDPNLRAHPVGFLHARRLERCLRNIANILFGLPCRLVLGCRLCGEWMMKSHYPAVAALAVLGFLTAASMSYATEPCPKNCPSGGVPLGIAAPQSGSMTAFGAAAIKATELAIEQVNDAGGLLGIRVVAVVADDRCAAGMAPTIAKQHIESKVGFVIGPACPAVAMDATPYYAKAGIVQFVPTVNAVELTERHPDNVFRMVANDAQEAKALASYLAREHADKKVAVVFGEFFYRRAIAKMIDAALSPEQKKLVRLESLADVTGAYDRLADRLKSSPPDLIYVSLDAKAAAHLVAKLQERGIKSTLLGGQHLLSANFWLNYRLAAEAIQVIVPIESLANQDMVRAVDIMHKAGVVPDIVALSNFAAVQIWAEAVRRAGSGDPRSVVAALRSGTFRTAVGNVAFDGRGDRRDIQYSIMTWKDGLPVPGFPWRP
jgi:branched-chain amino acid transport system substrate-binding protein